MAIDKSIRADYAIQGGGPNYLGKQKMVKAPKKWKSSPDHEPAELAYITKKEKDILLDLNLYGSLKNGKPNRGPSGIISLQGDMGSIGGSSSGSVGGEYAARQPHVYVAPPPRVVSRVSPQQSMAMTGNTSLAGKTQEQAQASVDSDNAMRSAEGKIDVGFQEVLRKQKIVEDLKKQTDEDFGFEDKKVKAPTTFKPKTKTITIHGKDGSYTKEQPVKYSPTYYQDRSKIGGKTYGERAEEGMKRGFWDSGLGTLAKGVGAAVAWPLASAFAPKELVSAAKWAKRAKDIKEGKGLMGKIATKFGVNEKFSNLTSTIDKAKAAKFTGSKYDKLNPNEMKNVRTRDDTPTSDGEAVNRKTLAQTVTQGTGLQSGQDLLGLDDEQIKNLYAVQNELNTTIDAGVYQGKQLTTDQIKLLQNKQMELNNLIQAIEKAKAPVNVAYGGRIDKAFTGRSRDI